MLTRFQDKLYTAPKCKETTILPSSVLYLFARKQWNDLFQIYPEDRPNNFSQNWRKVQESHAVHLWNYDSSKSNFRALNDRSQVMAALAKEKCPGTYTFLFNKELKLPLSQFYNDI